MRRIPLFRFLRAAASAGAAVPTLPLVVSVPPPKPPIRREAVELASRYTITPVRAELLLQEWDPRVAEAIVTLEEAGIPSESLEGFLEMYRKPGVVR